MLSISGMATVEKPENGYIIGKQYNLFHGELCTVKCHSGYELYSEENGFIDEDLLRIRNNNGSLEPQVPKCVESNVNLLLTFISSSLFLRWLTIILTGVKTKNFNT